MSDDLTDVFAKLAVIEAGAEARKAARRAATVAERARIRAEWPELADFCNALVKRGMFGRIVTFEPGA